MSSPLISICIPAYKADRYLATTLASVGNQTYPNWELIVVEDGSRDRAEEIVTAFSATVSQSVRFLRHEKNRGLPATRNTGIEAALGNWVALLDSDDLWKPEHLDTSTAIRRPTWCMPARFSSKAKPTRFSKYGRRLRR